MLITIPLFLFLAFLPFSLSSQPSSLPPPLFPESLPLPQLARFSLSSFTPFCQNFNPPEVSHDVIPQCIPWAEQELDMLHTYLDLISLRLDINLANQFYEQIRCLARSNIFPVPQLRAWQVCFSYDYSQQVGNLLANYILKDMALSKKKTLNTTAQTVRFFSFAKQKTKPNVAMLTSLFGNGDSFRVYEAENVRKVETACCQTCTNADYFVNVERGVCLNDPMGKHCCHKACKALGRLKIGASSSTGFCCHRCRPLPCAAG